jgi:hypothetical protein
MKVMYLLLLCGTASAQPWNYTGTLMTGTESTTAYTPLGPVFTSTPLSEAFDAQLVVGANSLAYTVSLDGQVLISGTAAGTNGWALGPGFIQPLYTNGAISGFDVSVQGADYGKSFASFSFGPGSGSYSFSNTYDSISLSGGSGTWTDPVNAVAAPEISPSGLALEFTLLAGGLAVLRGGKRGVGK